MDCNFWIKKKYIHICFILKRICLYIILVGFFYNIFTFNNITTFFVSKTRIPIITNRIIIEILFIVLFVSYRNIGSFYNVIRPVTLIQILIASNTQILIWFLASLVWYLKFVFLIVLKSFKAGYQIV